MRGCWIVEVDDEVLRGRRTRSTAGVLAHGLATLGVPATRQVIVSRQRDDLTAALREALDRVGVVVILGGLDRGAEGPTEEALEALRGTKEVKVLAAPAGLAPGLELDTGSTSLWALPDHPAAAEALFEARIAPALSPRRPRDGVTARHILRASGLDRDQLLARLEGVDHGGVSLSIRDDGPELEVTLEATGATHPKALARARGLGARICERLGRDVHGPLGQTIPAAVTETLRALGWTLATADLGLGGEPAWRLASAPDGRAALVSGLTATSTRALGRALGFDEPFGDAPNDDVVLDLAEAARARAGADIGLATWAFLDSSEGGPATPFGLVCFAVAGRAGREADRVSLGAHPAQSIGRWATAAALRLVLDRCRTKGR